MSFEIKPATATDIPLILELIKELAVYEKLQDMVVVTEASLAKWLFGERPVAEAVIGYYDNQPVGFALFFHKFSTFLGKPGIYLEDLYIKPEYRRQGFGQQFLRYLAKLAKERDCDRFEWSALNWNEPAINFYKKLGATPLEEWIIFRMTGEAVERLARGEL